MRFLIRRLGRTLRNALPVLLILLPAAAACQNRVVINADLAKDTISRNIYGHFSEHLGRCIYGGYYVGRGTRRSPIPGGSATTWSRRSRNSGSRTFAGPAAALPTPTTGKTASVPGRNDRRWSIAGGEASRRTTASGPTSSLIFASSSGRSHISPATWERDGAGFRPVGAIRELRRCQPHVRPQERERQG